MKKLSILLLLVLSFQILIAQKKSLLPEKLYQQALQYFEEAQQLSEKDGGKLWGKKLYGPMMFIKFPERILIANESDPKGYLQPQGKLFVGKLPSNIGMANTAQQWHGKTWTTVMWFRFSSDYRKSLFMHELFHRIQPELGYLGNTNQHLDERAARILIQLEWNALLAANLNNSKKEEIKSHIKAALIFRAYRNFLYRESQRNENALEMNEGLAEYTGLKLGGMTEEQIAKTLYKSVKQGKKRRTLVRSFAYISGPLYGFLLDRYASNWKQQLGSGGGFTKPLKQSLSLQVSDNPKVLKKQVRKLQGRYQAKEIRAYEKIRETKRKQVLKKYKTSLVDDVILKLDLTKKFNYTFNPSTLVAFKERGVIYPTITLRDQWGILKVKKGGALMANDKKSIVVNAGAGNLANQSGKIITDQWILELKEGWRLVKGKQNWGISK